MAYEPGHGGFDLGLGFDQDAGLYSRLRLTHRFNRHLFAGMEGRLTYDDGNPELTGLGMIGLSW
jgi:hypothetical protein